MERQVLGRTGRLVSVVGLGTWPLGADWGDVSEDDARAVLDASAEAGVTFFDTADVYGDGRSERLIGEFLRAHPDAGVTVATKMGRRVAQVPANYALTNFRAWTDRSRANLGVDTLDLVQLLALACLRRQRRVPGLIGALRLRRKLRRRRLLGLGRLLSLRWELWLRGKLHVGRKLDVGGNVHLRLNLPLPSRCELSVDPGVARDGGSHHYHNTGKSQCT